jgi:hypothetical protein
MKKALVIVSVLLAGCCLLASASVDRREVSPEDVLQARAFGLRHGRVDDMILEQSTPIAAIPRVRP